MTDSRTLNAWIAALVAFVLTAVFVAGLRRYAIRAMILDHPNERSSHARPTPRGGGAGLIAALLLVVLGALARTADVALLVALLAIIPTAVIGWIDDRKGVSPGKRLVVHVISGAMILPLVFSHPVPFSGPVMALGALWIFVTIAAINIINFMDGIDGIIGLQSVILGAHFALASSRPSAGFLIGLVMAAAALGFLVWNWPPARIFLGDVGSGALGVVGIVAGIVVMQETSRPIYEVFLPIFPLGLDAVITLLLRVRRGERITQAHRTHLYQRLANGGMGHARVTLLYGAAAVAAVPILLLKEGAVPRFAMLYAIGVILLALLFDKRARAG